LRIKVDSQKRNGAFFSMLSNELRACPGVLDVTANPVTASVLIRHTAAEAKILQFVAARSLFNLVSSNESHADVSAQMTAGMRGFSRNLQSVTGDALDMNALIVLGLAGLAIQQTIEGNIMAPAVSLLWYAYNASRMPHLGREPQPAEVCTRLA